MGWPDYLIITLFLGSIAIGVNRGLVKEALSLASWGLAFFGASHFAPMIADNMETFISNQPARSVIAYGLIFITSLLVLGIASKLIVKALRSVGLGLIDRILGVVFGSLRGGLIVCVLLLVIGATPIANESVWENSPSVITFKRVNEALLDLLPPGNREELLDGLGII